MTTQTTASSTARIGRRGPPLDHAGAAAALAPTVACVACKVDPTAVPAHVRRGQALRATQSSETPIGRCTFDTSGASAAKID